MYIKHTNIKLHRLHFPDKIAGQIIVPSVVPIFFNMSVISMVLISVKTDLASRSAFHRRIYENGKSRKRAYNKK